MIERPRRGRPGERKLYIPPPDRIRLEPIDAGEPEPTPIRSPNIVGCEECDLYVFERPALHRSWLRTHRNLNHGDAS